MADTATPPPAPAQRLDKALVAARLARSRGHARELIDGGHVRVDGRLAERSSMIVALDSEVALTVDGPHWVGRAAHKLRAALDRWPAVADSVPGARAIDVGASTGGFTQVLLRAGAAEVVALDVGHGQLAAELRRDPRVREHSGVSIRDVEPDDLGGPADIVAADLSFISLTLVLGRISQLLAPAGHAVLLVKPQFEVGRTGLGKRGIVTDPRSRHDALRRVITAAERAGLAVHGLAQSPLRGTEGNVEYLLWLRHESSAKMEPAVLAAVLDSLGGGT